MIAVAVFMLLVGCYLTLEEGDMAAVVALGVVVAAN